MVSDECLIFSGFMKRLSLEGLEISTKVGMLRKVIELHLIQVGGK